MLRRLSLKPFWIQALIILSPIIALVLIPIVFNRFSEGYFMGLLTAKMSTLFLFLLFGWQYYLGILSLREMDQKATFFKINGAIPVVSWALSVLLSMLGSIIIPANYLTEQFGSPILRNLVTKYYYFLIFMAL